MTYILTDEALAAMPDHQWATLEVKLRRWHGFEEGNAITDISDRPVQGLIYMKRIYHGEYQYLSLLYAHDHSHFLEAVLLVYDQPLNTRAKQRQVPLCATILRGGLEDILTAVNRVYSPLSKKP